MDVLKDWWPLAAGITLFFFFMLSLLMRGMGETSKRKAITRILGELEPFVDGDYFGFRIRNQTPWNMILKDVRLSGNGTERSLLVDNPRDLTDTVSGLSIIKPGMETRWKTQGARAMEKGLKRITGAIVEVALKTSNKLTYWTVEVDENRVRSLNAKYRKQFVHK